MAQCLISILLRKPDYARARPSTLLTDDETYKFLYEDNQNLEAYYKVAMLGKNMQNHLKQIVELTPAERSDILFYLLYAVVAKKVGKKSIAFLDLSDLDITCITYQEIEETRVAIFTKYKELSGNGRVAKSSTFIEKIDKILNL